MGECGRLSLVRTLETDSLILRLLECRREVVRIATGIFAIRQGFLLGPESVLEQENDVDCEVFGGVELGKVCIRDLADSGSDQSHDVLVYENLVGTLVRANVNVMLDLSPVGHDRSVSGH